MSFAVRVHASPEEATGAARDAGLPGWKCALHRHPESTGIVAVLTSPEFNPVTKTGRMVTRRGRDAADAFAQAVSAAKGN